MSFTANILIGSVPLQVEFLDTTPDHATHGEVAEWNWDFDDGSSSTEQNPTHIYSESGRYSPSLIVVYADTTTETFTNTDYIIALGLLQSNQRDMDGLSFQEITMLSHLIIMEQIK
jgi:serine protease